MITALILVLSLSLLTCAWHLRKLAHRCESSKALLLGVSFLISQQDYQGASELMSRTTRI